MSGLPSRPCKTERGPHWRIRDPRRATIPLERRCALTQASTMQHVVGDVGNQHPHEAVVHMHDHYQVSHHHSGGVLGEFEHRTAYHEHEHNHAPLVHAHGNRSETEEREDHDGTAHTHDHDAPTGTGL